MRYLLTILFIFSLFGCAASKHQDWTFMQSVGGLSVVGQDKNPDWLIVRGDISGLREFSARPVQMNSGLAVREVKAIIKDSRIQIYVKTTIISKTYSTTEISGVKISGAKRGTYMVQYLNPDNSTVDLKEVTLW